MGKTTQNTIWKLVQGDVKRSLRDYATLTVTGLINTLYVLLWAATQWYASRLLESFELIGTDAVVLRTFQIIFGVTTIVPPCFFIYRDFRIAWLKIKREIEFEAKLTRRK